MFRYWWPTDGRGPINNDTFAVLKGAKNPVLAHLFLNHLLDTKQVFNNFNFTYYQQPINAMTPEALVSGGVIAAEPQVDDHPRVPVQERPRAGPAQPAGRGAVGERLGGGQVHVSDSATATSGSYWRAFALPGVVWLCLFVVVPAYAVLAMATGKVNLLLDAGAGLESGHLESGLPVQGVLRVAARRRVLAGGAQHARLRRRLAAAVLRDRLPGRLLRGAPRASRTKKLLIMLLVIPFWVSYLLRMLAWIGLLSTDGYVNKLLTDIGIPNPPNWLDGNAVLGDPGAASTATSRTSSCPCSPASTGSTAARSRRRATSARPRFRRSCA